MGHDNLPQILLSMGARNTLFLRQPRFPPVIKTEQTLLQVTLRLLKGNIVQVQVAGRFLLKLASVYMCSSAENHSLSQQVEKMIKLADTGEIS